MMMMIDIPRIYLCIWSLGESTQRFTESECRRHGRNGHFPGANGRFSAGRAYRLALNSCSGTIGSLKTKTASITTILLANRHLFVVFLLPGAIRHFYWRKNGTLIVATSEGKKKLCSEDFFGQYQLKGY